MTEEEAHEYDRLYRWLVDARLWLKACLNMVDGNGMPPNWDGIRAFLLETSEPTDQ